MKNQKRFILTMSTILVFASLQVAVLGQTASQSIEAKVANVRAEGMAVRFDSAIPYSNATLTISGPDGTVYRREFAGGTAPSWSLFDKTGATLGNGQYTYELRFTVPTVDACLCNPPSNPDRSPCRMAPFMSGTKLSPLPAQLFHPRVSTRIRSSGLRAFVPATH